MASEDIYRSTDAIAANGLEFMPPPPAILQVLPALVSGGVERGTVEIAEAIAAAGYRSLVASAGGKLVVDNVLATPMLQRPLEFGADIVVYSATKHIDGQGRALAGAILGPKSYYKDNLQPLLRHTGPACSPFNAWIMLKGLETMDIRVERHCRNAQAVAEFLETQPGVKRVVYPGLKSHPQYELA